MNCAEEFDKLRRGIGVTAEMALIFMRAAIDAGATKEEATKLTQAFISAITYGKPKNRPEE